MYIPSNRKVGICTYCNLQGYLEAPAKGHLLANNSCCIIGFIINALHGNVFMLPDSF